MYVEQMNEFIKRAKEKHISPHARSVYIALFDICNKLRWPDWFTCSDRQVMEEAAVGNPNTMIKCRKELLENGFIEYVPSRKRGVASEWRLVRL